MSYQSEIAQSKTYQENVVIKFYGEYFSILKPDSGLEVKEVFNKTVASCVLNPTTVDLRRVSTTIANYSFKIVDRAHCLSQIVQGNAGNLMGQPVEIYIGRVGVGMDFSEYKMLPITRIKKVDFSDKAYNISSSEETDRMDKPIYQYKTKLRVNTLDITTILSAKDSLVGWPTSGYLVIDREIISYTGINTVKNYFTGCTRALLGSEANDYRVDQDVFFMEIVEGNAVDILLQILTSGSGVGAYDVLESGCAIDPSLIDIAAIEDLRDDIFSNTNIRCYLFDVNSALKLIEDEILTPFRLRLVTTEAAKISLKRTDTLDVMGDIEIDPDSISKTPKWTVDDNKIVNQLEIDWDYDEASGNFAEKSVFNDPISIANYGAKTPLKYSFKFIRADLDGYEILDNLQTMIFERLGKPNPEITINTQMDKSGIEVLDRLLLTTQHVPEFDGSDAFSNEVEVLSKGINHNTGDVQYKVAFTSGSFNRFCYIAPSDMVMSVNAQDEIVLPAGRADMYKVGWKMRLYDNDARAYVAGEPVNEIAEIDGDTITFTAPFVEPLTTHHRLKFADYDQVVRSQKAYCFISDDGQNFSDSKRTYVISL